MHSRTRTRTIALTVALFVALGAGACAAPANANGVGQAAADKIATQLGVRYTYGGSSPATGFDCSGLTSWAYRQVGITIPRTATDQYNASTPVSRKNLQPGDLVFYGYGGNFQHVGMYVGNGYMIDAPNPSTTVEKVNVDQWWTDALIGYGRPDAIQ